MQKPAKNMFSKRALYNGFYYIVTNLCVNWKFSADIQDFLFHFSMFASSLILSRTSHIQPAKSFASASLKPRRVIAGEPIRIPDVTNGLRGSFWHTIFVHSDISTTQCSISIFTCNIFINFKSNKNKWFSVPPDTTL